MILNSPYISGSLTVTGTTVLSGSVTLASGASIAGTASLATTALTASSVANLNQNVQVTGSLTVSSAITAQTLVVQTVTSSVVYSSGSNIFGNSTSNTQQFTGSVLMTGSLVLSGPSTFSSNLTLGASSGFPSVGLLNRSSDSNLYMVSATSGFILLDNSQNTMYNATPTSHTWNISNAAKMTLTSIGDLLINDVAANDSAKLQVNATSGTAFAMTNTTAAAADTGSIMYFWGTTGYNSMASIGSFWEAASNTNAYLQFKTRGSSTNSEKMRITSAGNVGINDASPSKKLVVKDTAATQALFCGYVSLGSRSDVDSGEIQIGSNASYNGKIGYTNAGNTTFSIDNTYNSVDAATQFRMRTAGTPVTAMTILGSGFVGIGTASPTSPLDAYGTTGYSSQWRYVITAKSVDYPTIRLLATNSGKVSLIGNNNDGSMYFFVNGDATTTQGDNAFTISSNRQIVFNSAVYNNSTGGAARTLYIANDYYIGGISSIRASKKNIENVSNVNWLYQLNPVTFNYRKKDEDGNYTEEIHDELNYGLIAEDTAPIADFLINYNDKEDGTKEMIGIEYSRLITPLLKAIQEQQTLIESLKARIEVLESK